MLINEIKKEQIPDMVSPKKDVLKNETDKKKRQEELKFALQLGNNDKHKAKIVFNHSSGFAFVYNTVRYMSDFHKQS